MFKAELQGSHQAADARQDGTLSGPFFECINVRWFYSRCIIGGNIRSDRYRSRVASPISQLTFGGGWVCVTAVGDAFVSCQVTPPLLLLHILLPSFPLTLSDSSGGGVEGGRGGGGRRGEGGDKSGHICCFAGSLRRCSPGSSLEPRSLARSTR